MTSNPWLSVFLVLDGLFITGWVWWNAARKSGRRRKPISMEAPRVPASADLAEERLGFGAESVALSPETRTVLEEAAVRLQEQAASKIWLEGSADDTGNLTRNRRLSRGRAEAARRFLIALGVSPSRITVVALEPAYGATEGERQALRCVTVRWTSGDR